MTDHDEDWQRLIADRAASGMTPEARQVLENERKHFKEKKCPHQSSPVNDLSLPPKIPKEASLGPFCSTTIATDKRKGLPPKISRSAVISVSGER